MKSLRYFTMKLRSKDEKLLHRHENDCDNYHENIKSILWAEKMPA